MDSRLGDEMLLLAVAERDMGAFCTLYERHAGFALAATAVVMCVPDVITRPGVLPDGMSRRWGA